MRRALLPLGTMALLASCGDDHAALRPASEVRLSNQVRDGTKIEWGKPFKLGTLSVIISLPERSAAADERQHYYGAPTWTMTVYIENASNDPRPVPRFSVLCADTDREGSWWASSTLTSEELPARTTADGTVVISTPVDFGAASPDNQALPCSTPTLRAAASGSAAFAPSSAVAFAELP